MRTVRWSQATPFGLCLVLGLASVLLPPYAPRLALHLAAAGILLVATGVAVLGWGRAGASTGVAAPLLALAATAVLRDATGGAASGVAPLVAVPVLWTALYGSRRALAVVAGGVVTVFVLPVLVGLPGYPTGDWRRALLWCVVTVIIGPVVQEVVRARAAGDQDRRSLVSSLDGLLAAATEHAITVTDPDGIITTFSEGAERMLGYRAQDVVGRLPIGALHDPDEVRTRAGELGVTLVEVFRACAERGQATGYWTYLCQDGSRVPVRLSVTTLVDESGALVGYVGIARDVRAEQAVLEELRAAEQRWRVLLDHLPDTSVLVVGPDLRYRLAVGTGLARQQMTDVTGRTPAEVSSPATAAVLESVLRSALAGTEATTEVVGTRSGLATEIVATPLPPSAGEPEVLLVARDVSDTRRRMDQLRAAEERSGRLFDDAPHGIAVVAPSGVVSRANRSLVRLLGSDPVVTGLSMPALLGLDADAWGDLLTDPTGRLAGEARVPVGPGPLDVAWECAVLHDGDGRPEAVLVNLVDVSERRRYEAQLAHLADHDPLTGLANRRRFDADLATHLARCMRYGAKGAVMMLDLDHFKEVNDTLGHGAGDQLIVSVAELLRSRLRSTDVVARLGGDEFAVLLPEADQEAAERVAADLVETIRTRATVIGGGRARRVTTSLGVVMVDETRLTPSELMSTVDLTMYDAKEAGRDRHCLLDTRAHAVPRSGARMVWADRIVAALDEERFELLAQPILEVPTGRIRGAELLVRMIGEKGELIPPGRFLDVAERLGLVGRLDDWVVNRSIDLLEAIHARDPGFRLEVNLSGASVGDAALADRLANRIRTAAINPRNLVLEITETAAVADIEVARAFADTVEAAGGRFALDDFGAGFGSFYYLKHLPSDFVKIDGEFVSRCVSNQTDRVILSSIVGMARGMGKQTIAEFVSDAEILAVVSALGVDHAQGYHIGRPAPLSELLDWTAAPADSPGPRPRSGHGA